MLVWSLQSFHGGGFLKGEPGFVYQDMTDNCPSVVVSLKRSIDSVRQIDETYEVYSQQCISVRKSQWNADKDLKKLRKQIMKDE